MKAIKIILALIYLLCLSVNCFAENLLDIYHQAVVSDPTFKAAQEQWFAAKENLPISIANLLPNISAQAGISRSRNVNSTFAGPNLDFYDNNSNFSVILQQPLFNLNYVAGVWQTQDLVKQAEATYIFSIQDLITRTAQAYFAVLQAENTLTFTRANKEAVLRLLEQTQHKYDVGLIAIMDLENTKASYDKATSDEIAADKSLADQIEKLAEITGKKYTSLNTLKDRFPLTTPKPSCIDKWVTAAQKQNYNLLATKFAAEAARQNIKVQAANHLPTVTGNLEYGNIYNNNAGGFDFGHSKTASMGLNVNMPIFSGGSVTALTRQAEYTYQQALANEEQTSRSVISNTRQSYLGVVAAISKIIADQQLVKSTESVVQSTKAGYEVGTRTMVDVLKAESDYYSAQDSLSKDGYYYLTQILLLKQFAGIIDVNDLKEINSWMMPAKIVEHQSSIAKALQCYTTSKCRARIKKVIPCNTKAVTTKVMSEKTTYVAQKPQAMATKLIKNNTTQTSQKTVTTETKIIQSNVATTLQKPVTTTPMSTTSPAANTQSVQNSNSIILPKTTTTETKATTVNIAPTSNQSTTTETKTTTTPPTVTDIKPTQNIVAPTSLAPITSSTKTAHNNISVTTKHHKATAKATTTSFPRNINQMPNMTTF